MSVLVGGYTKNYGDHQRTVREWDGDTWHERPVKGGPQARRHLGATYDSTRRRVLILGGNNAEGAFDDLWSWDGKGWKKLTANPHPANSELGVNQVPVRVSPMVTCPSCGEDDKLRGRRDGDVIHLTCEVCNHTWDRDTVPKCFACGATGESLNYRPIPLFSKGRGTMQTPTGQRESWDCDICGQTDCTRPPA